MAVETSAATGALIKWFGVPVLAGATAATLGFMFMWPKTPKEFFVRIASTIIMSAIGGPLLVIALHQLFPETFASAQAVAVLYGIEPAFGFLLLAAPVLVIAGLPAWFVLGGLMRWLEKRKDKDLAELASDAASAVHQIRDSV